MLNLRCSTAILYGRNWILDVRLWSGLAGFFLATSFSLTVVGQPIFPAISVRSEAIVSLDHDDVRKRAAAGAFIARTGLPVDGPLLVKRLSDDSPLVRELAQTGLWQVWSRSGDAETDRRLAAGIQQMSGGKIKEALHAFSHVIQRRPDFAEGWNKRATAYYLAGEFRKSLADCAEVIKRNPQHFGALSGYGQIYFQLGEYDKSLEYYRRALAVNPNMDGVQVNIRAIEVLLREKHKRMI